MIRLPTDWTMKPLGSVATLQRGFDLPVQARCEGSVTIFAANGPVGTHNVHKVKGPGVVTGRSGTLGKVQLVEEDYWPLNTALWVKDFHGNDPAWVFRLLSWMHLEQFTRGAGVPTLNRNLVHVVEVPVPPLAEQKRIAGILDAADALRAKRRESLALLDTLLQSSFLDVFGDCDRPPISIGSPTFGDASKFVLLSQVARLATGHTPDRKTGEYWGGEIPWVSLTDIRELDGQLATATLQNVTEAGIANSSSVKLPAGTVCFSRTASVGFVLVMGREMATSQDFVNWVCGDQLDPIYLMWALRQSRPYLLSKSSGSTHKTIYYRHAEKFQVFLPPLGLQRRFAAIFKSIEEQKRHQRAHLVELDTLFASLQSRAFRGEL